MHRKLITALLVFPMLIMANSFVYAKNLGKIGQTYPIKEMDMLDFIQTHYGDQVDIKPDCRYLSPFSVII